MPGRTRVAIADLYRIIGAALRALPPEAAHRATIAALRTGLAAGARSPDDALLATRLWGIDFANPIGLAAGFDKDAEVVGPLLGLGFGLVEAGTVTPRPQPGNPRPRLFRLVEDQAVINRLGFNSGGLDAFAARLGAWRDAGGRGPVGANIGRNKDSADAVADYVQGVSRLAPLADYLVINVSSPNTPGLRDLQGRDALAALVGKVLEARARACGGAGPPLLVKIAPDLGPADRADIAAVTIESGIDGLIVCNTTVARPATLRSRHRGEAGGLSGRPLLGPSTALLAEMYRLTGGKVVLIGCGGVASGADAYAKIRAGASLVQLYTALIYRGPGLVRRIKDEVAALLRSDGLESVAQAVGRGNG